jgi:threonine aldolase
MAAAEVGDDVMGEDPTANELQDRLARLFGKESALFFPSGTMSNLAAAMAWTGGRGSGGSEIVVGEGSHMFLYEQAGVCQFGGVSMRTVRNNADGSMPLVEVRAAIREHDACGHEPITRMIAVENTHNAAGGAVLPASFMAKLARLCARDREELERIPIHMDGARIWNAIAASKATPASIAEHADSLSVCLSKGLGAPAGSVLIGPKALIARARRIRKALGGGMRQVGVLAAAGLQALDDFFDGDHCFVDDDHRRARALIRGIDSSPTFRSFHEVETNIVFFRIEEGYFSAASNNARIVCDALRERHGVLAAVWEDDLIRMVVHRDVTDDDVRRTVEAVHAYGNSVLLTAEDFSRK